MKQKTHAPNFLMKTVSSVLLYSFIFTNVFTIQFFAQSNSPKSVYSQNFNKFTTDLTELAAQGKIRPAANLDNEVNRLVQMLASSNFRQPVVLDDKNNSQELVIELLATRIASGNVPAKLSGKRVLKLETDVLFSNTKSAEEISDVTNSIFSELSGSDKNTIMFVDELSHFVGNSQINDTLTNALLQGKVNIIGGSSKVSYLEKIDSSVRVAGLFETILIGSGQDGLTENKQTVNSEEFRGDKVSSDLREMLQNDPSGKKRVDVIIQAKDANNASLRAIMAENGVRLQDRIGSTDTIVVNLPLSAIEAIAQSGIVNYISPDRKLNFFGHLENTVGATLTRSQPASGTRAAYTLDGTGVGIAVLDSGLLSTHKDFKNNGNSSRIVYSKNFVTTESDSDDNYGHGTHVAGIAAGNSSSNSGAYRGVAPNSNIINLKVLDGLGRGQTSWLLNALDWIKLNYQTYNIKVVNLSLGGPAIDTYTNDPACRKVRELGELGILVVAAAGNDGKNAVGDKLYGRIHSPGNDPSVLTVGAVNTKDTDSRSDDNMATFSSRGPTRSFYVDGNGTKVYDNAIKPDIIAPGNKIISARAKPTCYLATHLPDLSTGLINSLDANDSMMSMSGTSMATPVAAGAAALLFQVNPNLTPQMVKMIFEYTAQPLNGYTMFEQGAGQLNIEGAVKLAKAYRTDINFNTSATPGMSLLATGAVFPTPITTLNGATFNWSQGILTNHTYVKGQTLASNFQNVYKNNMWFEKGVYHNASFNYVLNDNFSNLTALTITPKVVVSNGSTLGGGSVYCAFGVVVSDGILVNDGILVSDGVLISDSVLVSDSVLISDGVLISDSVLVSDGVLVSDTDLNTVYGDN